MQLFNSYINSRIYGDFYSIFQDLIEPYQYHMDNSEDCMCLCVFNMLHVRSEFACVIPTRTRAWQYSSPRDCDKGLVGINKAVTSTEPLKDTSLSSLICRRLVASPQLEIYRDQKTSRFCDNLRNNPTDGSLSHYSRCTGCTR